MTSSDPVRVALTGASGRMGRAVLSLIADTPTVELAGAIAPEATRVDGVAVQAEFALEDVLTSADVLIDFSAPAATVTYASACVDADVALVSGTTGFANAQYADLEASASEIPILHASNFSRGMQAVHAATEAALKVLEAYDIEITETHHNGKVDAPSGTAKELLKTIQTARPGAPTVSGREGTQPRQSGEIGVFARRAGDIRGEHEVLFAGNDEVLTITHRVGSREVFAAGALDAAVWIFEQAPGLYSFEEVIECA